MKRRILCALLALCMLLALLPVTAGAANETVNVAVVISQRVRSTSIRMDIQGKC
ncbi:MAG: hypothetical protein V8T01_10050 [Oscillospiraceae bacterium]